MNGACNSTFFPASWGPGDGSKGQISLYFNHKVSFKDFYTKFCVCPMNHGQNPGPLTPEASALTTDLPSSISPTLIAFCNPLHVQASGLLSSELSQLINLKF